MTLLPDLDNSRVRLYTKSLLIVFSFGTVAFYAFNIAIRGEPFHLAGDTTNVWIPFAECVLNGGQMYLCQWDNKPPLFHFLNLTAAASGHYVFVWFFFLGVATSGSALLLWRFCKKWGYDRVGLVSAILFVGLMASMNWRINPRQFGLFFVLLAFVSSKPIRSGVYIAIGGMFTQFTVFFIPAVIWLHTDLPKLQFRWLMKFCIAGIGTVIVVYTLVAALWSVDAAITGFQYAFLNSGEYVAGYNARGLSLYGDPIAWVYKAYRGLNWILWLVLTAFLGSIIALSNHKESRFHIGVVLASLGALIPFTIRTANVYQVSMVPFFAILSLWGIEYLLHDEPSQQLIGPSE